MHPLQEADQCDPHARLSAKKRLPKHPSQQPLAINPTESSQAVTLGLPLTRSTATAYML